MRERTAYSLGAACWSGLVLVCFLLAGCSPARLALAGGPGGEIEQGADALRAYGCGACHTIPGIPGANTRVGPPLSDWAERHYIAGTLPNTPENMVRWIQDPQAIRPGTAMPDLDVTDEDARHMSAYLYSLGRNLD